MTLLAESLLSMSAELLLLVDPRTLNIVRASPSVQLLLGFRPDEIEGRPITDLECALSDVFFWENARSGGSCEIVNTDGLYQDAGGAIVAVEKSVMPVVCDGQTLVGIRARINTQVKATSDALEQVTASLRATLESTADGILVTNLDGGVINLNRRFAALWSLPEDLLAQRDDNRVYRAMARRLREPRSWRDLIADVTQARANDTFHALTLRSGLFLELRSKPFVVRGQLSGRVFSFTDVTERVRTQQQLQSTRDQAIAANNAKTQFLNHMSHEFRTPLNAIIGFAQLLQDDVENKQRNDVDRILQAGWHLQALINEALDLGAVEAGHMHVNIQALQIDEMFATCVGLTEQLARKKGIRLDNEISGAANRVLADPLRLRQILLNLISNAIKYGRAGGTVWLSAKPGAHGRSDIVVRDDGVGICAADQAKLFAEFTRVGSQQDRIEGSGIGLAVSRKIARLMGGDISLESQIGNGSTFTVHLPSVEASKPVNALQPAGLADTNFLADKTILYVDDDGVNRLLLSIVLQKQGVARALIEESGNNGFECAVLEQPDLVISDMNLGDMSGLDMLHKLKADPRTAHIPIMALSGTGTPDQIKAAMQAGFVHYFLKPLNVPTLLHALRTVFDKPSRT